VGVPLNRNSQFWELRFFYASMVINRIWDAVHQGFTYFGTTEVGSGCAFCTAEDIPSDSV